MYWAWNVVVDQVLHGGGTHSTKCRSSLFVYSLGLNHFLGEREEGNVPLMQCPCCEQLVLLFPNIRRMTGWVNPLGANLLVQQELNLKNRRSQTSHLTHQANTKPCVKVIQYLAYHFMLNSELVLIRLRPITIITLIIFTLIERRSWKEEVKSTQNRWYKIKISMDRIPQCSVVCELWKFDVNFIKYCYCSSSWWASCSFPCLQERGQGLRTCKIGPSLSGSGW